MNTRNIMKKVFSIIMTAVFMITGLPLMPGVVRADERVYVSYVNAEGVEQAPVWAEPLNSLISNWEDGKWYIIGFTDTGVTIEPNRVTETARSTLFYVMKRLYWQSMVSRSLQGVL